MRDPIDPFDPSGGTDEPLDSLTVQPVEFAPGRLNALTPMGQVESMGDFARGLGPRVIRAFLVVAALAMLAAALVSAIG